jgi:hypothetical protein
MTIPEFVAMLRIEDRGERLAAMQRAIDEDNERRGPGLYEVNAIGILVRVADIPRP